MWKSCRSSESPQIIIYLSRFLSYASFLCLSSCNCRVSCTCAVTHTHMQKHICSEQQILVVKAHDISITHRLAVCMWRGGVKSSLVSACKNHFLPVAQFRYSFVTTCLAALTSTRPQSDSIADINVINSVCRSMCEFSWRVGVWVFWLTNLRKTVIEFLSGEEDDANVGRRKDTMWQGIMFSHKVDPCNNPYLITLYFNLLASTRSPVNLLVLGLNSQQPFIRKCCSSGRR